LHVWRGLPTTSLGWLILAALVVISVQWGRGKWLPWRWSRVGLTVVSVFTVLALPFVLGYVGSQLAQPDYDNDAYVSDGLQLDGGQVTNIFAYGPDGNPISDVQLFDQNGRPLAASSSSNATQWVWDNATATETVLVPSAGAPSGSGWNVYPLKSVSSDAVNPETGLLTSWAKPAAVDAPFRSVQPLLGYTPPEEPAN
jgi:hypothetical protein